MKALEPTPEPSACSSWQSRQPTFAGAGDVDDVLLVRLVAEGADTRLAGCRRSSRRPPAGIGCLSRLNRVRYFAWLSAPTGPRTCSARVARVADVEAAWQAVQGMRQADRAARGEVHDAEAVLVGALPLVVAVLVVVLVARPRGSGRADVQFAVVRRRLVAVVEELDLPGVVRVVALGALGLVVPGSSPASSAGGCRRPRRSDCRLAPSAWEVTGARSRRGAVAEPAEIVVRPGGADAAPEHLGVVHARRSGLVDVADVGETGPTAMSGASRAGSWQSTQSSS